MRKTKALICTVYPSIANTSFFSPIPTFYYKKASELGICGQRRPRSACASAQSDQGLRCPLTKSLNFIECINREQYPDETSRMRELNLNAHLAHAQGTFLPCGAPYCPLKWIQDRIRNESIRPSSMNSLVSTDSVRRYQMLKSVCAFLQSSKGISMPAYKTLRQLG